MFFLVTMIKSNRVFVDGNYNFPNLDEYNKSMQGLLQHWVSKKLNLNEKAYQVPDFSRCHAKTRVDAEEDPHMKLKISKSDY